jgi:hypothetical protein
MQASVRMRISRGTLYEHHIAVSLAGFNNLHRRKVLVEWLSELAKLAALRSLGDSLGEFR